MTVAVVARAFGERWRALLGYGLGMGLMIVWVVALYPSVEGALADYIEAMPELMKTMFGVGSIDDVGAFLNVEIFSAVGPIIFIALGISFGAGTVAGEENARILPLVLSTPITRRRLLAAKLAAMTLDLAALGLVTFLSIVVGAALIGGGVSLWNAFAACLQLTALGWLFGTLALGIGAVTGRKAWATGASAGVAILAYLVDVMAPLVDTLERLEPLSPFDWYLGNDPMANGLSVRGLALLVGVTLVLAAVAAIGFERRDVGA